MTDAPRLLDALLAAVEEQHELLAADIEQLWDDLFVESCAEWAVPYIGALLGLPTDAERLEVAYAIALRRRKGTPAALEDFAEILTGLTARVVEGWQVTAWTQRLGHPPPLRPVTADFEASTRFRIGTPFEPTRSSWMPSGRFSPQTATAVVWPWTVRTFHRGRGRAPARGAAIRAASTRSRGSSLPQATLRPRGGGRAAGAHRRRARRAGPRHLPGRPGARGRGPGRLRDELDDRPAASARRIARPVAACTPRVDARRNPGALVGAPLREPPAGRSRAGPAVGDARGRRPAPGPRRAGLEPRGHAPSHVAPTRSREPRRPRQRGGRRPRRARRGPPQPQAAGRRGRRPRLSRVRSSRPRSSAPGSTRTTRAPTGRTSRSASRRPIGWRPLLRCRSHRPSRAGA